MWENGLKPFPVGKSVVHRCDWPRSVGNFYIQPLKNLAPLHMQTPVMWTPTTQHGF